jgi:hypothetical protein
VDKKPVIPSDFPSEMKDLIHRGWSKDPKERPPIQEILSALNKMLTGDGREKIQSSTLPQIVNSSSKMQDSSSAMLEENSKENNSSRGATIDI